MSTPLPVPPYSNQPYYQTVNATGQAPSFPVNDRTKRIQIITITSKSSLPDGTNVKIKQLDGNADGGGVEDTYNFNPKTLVFDNAAGKATGNPYSNEHGVTFELDTNMNKQFNYSNADIIIEYRVI